MLIAVPSDAPGGLEARISDHFGHCDFFTLVPVEDGEVGEATVLANEGHAQGGCMGPVTILKSHGVDALVAGGMGQRPLAGFQRAGIRVYSKETAATVLEAVKLLTAGGCAEFGDDHTCAGHGGHCGGHGHEPTPREVVDGPVEKDRVVRLSFRLTDEGGEEIDAAHDVHYLHGYGQLVPGLERALEGQVAGATLEVTVPPEDGFGERDAQRTMRVPCDQLPEGSEPGSTVHASLPNGGVIPLQVLSVEERTATLDANHPLAGRTLVFAVEVHEVLAATPEELAHRHVH